VTLLKCSNLRTHIPAKVVELLDRRDVRHSSVDLVRFSWVEKNDDVVGGDDFVGNEDDDSLEENDDVTGNEGDDNLEDVDIKVAPDGTVVTTPVTIWVGVLPDTLTGEVAFHSSNDLLDLLKKHGISDIDVAYRESVVRDLSGPVLFAPAADLDPLKAVIDPVTTALSLPIAGLKTPHIQGTLGFYFNVDKTLYAVTARHILFPESEGNYSYSYSPGTFLPLGRWA